MWNKCDNGIALAHAAHCLVYKKYIQHLCHHARAIENQPYH